MKNKKKAFSMFDEPSGNMKLSNFKIKKTICSKCDNILDDGTCDILDTRHQNDAKVSNECNEFVNTD